jgi:hypothetical protein
MTFCLRHLLGSVVVSAISATAFANIPPAQTAGFYDQNYLLPLLPRISGLGLLGDGQMLDGDAMAALWGNQNHILFLDAQAKTAFDTDWMGSLGAGLRGIYDQRIYGAYVFVDRTISPYNNEFWFVSPGIETLGFIDFRANGYFPTSSKRQYGTTDWADNFGVFDFVSFHGHQQFDILMTQDEEVGWGADAEIGSIIPGTHNVRLYAGGYHFNFDNADDINGVAGRLEIPVNRYLALSARDSYDNVQHNTFMAGVRLTLGGVNYHPRDQHQAIQERILDPIERNMATLGQGAGEPIQKVLTPIISPLPPLPPSPPIPPVPPLVERDNIWFFSPTATGTFDGTINACTAENPCISTDFTQSTIDGINVLKQTDPLINDILSTSPSFFLAPTTYDALNAGGPLVFTNDWIFGRTADFSAPLQSATLEGSLSFFGDNNLLDHMIVVNSATTPQPYGILLNTAQLTINTSRIGVDPPAVGTDSFTTAIQMQDSILTVNANSEIYAQNENAPAYGINAEDTQASGSTINLNDSLLRVYNNIDGPTSGLQSNLAVAGIRMSDTTDTGTTGGTVNLNNSNIEVLADVNIINQSLVIAGISAGINSPVVANPFSFNLLNSQILVQPNASTQIVSGFTFVSAGITVVGQDKDISMNNSAILISDTTGSTGSSANAGARSLIGLRINGTGTANIDMSNGSSITTNLIIGQLAAPNSNRSLSNNGVLVSDLISDVNLTMDNSTIQAMTTSNFTLNNTIDNSNVYGFRWGSFGAQNTFNADVTDSNITAMNTINNPAINVSASTFQTFGFRFETQPLMNTNLNIINSNIEANTSITAANYTGTINSTGISANSANFLLNMFGDSSISASTTDHALGNFNITSHGVFLNLGSSTNVNSQIFLHNDSEINAQTEVQTSSASNSRIFTRGIAALGGGIITRNLTSNVELNDNSNIQSMTTVNKTSSFLQTLNGLIVVNDGIGFGSLAGTVNEIPVLDSTITLNGDTFINSKISVPVAIQSGSGVIATSQFNASGILQNYAAIGSAPVEISVLGNSEISAISELNKDNNAVSITNTQEAARGIVNDGPSFIVNLGENGHINAEGVFNTSGSGNSLVVYGIDSLNNNVASNYTFNGSLNNITVSSTTNGSGSVAVTIDKSHPNPP